jgi:hypothetical protein
MHGATRQSHRRKIDTEIITVLINPGKLIMDRLISATIIRIANVTAIMDIIRRAVINTILEVSFDIIAFKLSFDILLQYHRVDAIWDVHYIVVRRYSPHGVYVIIIEFVEFIYPRIDYPKRR